jgi:carbon storage regulator
MLVLRRKVGEAIVLNNVITVYVLAVEGERVKLGINAPPDVVIVRQELLDADVQAQRAAKLAQRAAEAGAGEEKGERRGPVPGAEGGGRRDLRAMLDRAMSNTHGTLPPRMAPGSEVTVGGLGIRPGGSSGHESLDAEEEEADSPETDSQKGE